MTRMREPPDVHVVVNADTHKQAQALADLVATLAPYRKVTEWSGFFWNANDEILIDGTGNEAHLREMLPAVVGARRGRFRITVEFWPDAPEEPAKSAASPSP
jgi:hypothetical protein